MSKINYDDLHCLLDGLTHGEHIKTTWTGKHTATFEGPVHIVGTYCSCVRTLRWGDGTIEKTLTSIEVIRTEEVTVTRDDEEALIALLNSLVDGEEVTAEWRDEYGSMILTGPVQNSDYGQQVHGYNYNAAVLRWGYGKSYPALRAVTVHRNVVKRWEREDHE